MNAPAKRRRVLSEEDTAIEAAAERRLTQLKTERVGRAEAALADARQQLAKAQTEEVRLARIFAVNPGQRALLLEGRANLEVTASLVAHYERELDRARVRWTPEQMKAARDLERAERKRAALMTELQPHLQAISDATGAVIKGIRAAMEVIETQHGIEVERGEAADLLGIEMPEYRVQIPYPQNVTSMAVLEGCKAARYDACDWSEYVRPTRVMQLPDPSAAAALARPVDLDAQRDARLEQQTRINTAFQLQLEQDGLTQSEKHRVERVQAHEAEIAQRRATLIEQSAAHDALSRVPGRDLFGSRTRSDQHTFGDRASLREG